MSLYSCICTACMGTGAAGFAGVGKCPFCNGKGSVAIESDILDKQPELQEESQDE